jgi:hypothetical protein
MSAAALHPPRDAGASLQIGGDITPTLCVKTGAVVARWRPIPSRSMGTAQGRCSRSASIAMQVNINIWLNISV